MIFTNIFQHIKEQRKNIYFRFWANCILVKGYRNGVVFDLQRARTIKVSKLFYETFEQNKNMSINVLYNEHTFPNKKGYFKMLDYFVKNDFGILTDDIESLPELSMEYDSPFYITNVILEVNTDTNPEHLFNIIKKVADGHIQAIQINDYGHISIKQLKQICELTKHSPLECINIYTFYKHSFSKKQLAFLYSNSRFRNITFMGAPRNRSFENYECGMTVIRYINKVIDYKDCGNIGKDNFLLNQSFFIESHNFNSCLNRKVCIDKNGLIKNCPLMRVSYGNINDCSFKDISKLPKFTNLWQITKDSIEVCRDCEYRYICQDCRYYKKDINNILSQPFKCTYNPYIGKWKGENGYVPVEECGKYSTEKGFEPDKIIIENIISKLEYDD